MVGLISIIVLTAKTKWLALLAFFLPTHPLPLIAMMLKQLEQCEQALKADGQPLGFAFYSV